MNSKIFYYFLIGGLIIAAMAGLAGLYYVAFGNLDGLIPPVFRPNSTAENLPPAPALSPTDPNIALSVDKNGRLVLSWKNLGSGIRDIQIFRAREGQPRWSLWKTISVSDLSSGLIQLQGAYSQGLLSYIYRFEGVGDEGEILWTSSSTSITGGATGPSAPAIIPSPPSSGQNPPSSGAPSGGGSPNTPASPISSTPTSPPAESTSTVTYYTPQGDISGSASITIEQFWVRKINKKLQIGWSNLNTSSTEVVIFRSLAANGPWATFFRQSQPVTEEPYSILLLDDAVSQSAYYKLESYSAASTTLDTYGPVLFEPAGS